MADPSQHRQQPTTGTPSSTSSLRTNAPARRAISWASAARFSPARGRSGLGPATQRNCWPSGTPTQR